MAHGSQVRPVHALSAEVKMKVIQLARSKYAGFNLSHFTDLLKEK